MKTAIVTVKTIPEARTGLAHRRQLGSVREEKIRPSVVVVIERGKSAGHGFGEIFLRRRAVCQHETRPGRRIETNRGMPRTSLRPRQYGQQCEGGETDPHGAVICWFRMRSRRASSCARNSPDR